MSSGQSSQQSSSSTWTEPPWCGWIETTGDALLILEAARRGLIPRVTRRLVDAERKMINSGSVFVFDEDESGIKRWTDGYYWSPSRILGNFLLYRETDKRGAGHRSVKADMELNGEGPSEGLSRSKVDGSGGAADKHRERSLVGSLTNSYKFKPDGLMKKTFSLSIAGVAQHLISYYKIEDVENGRLRSPSSLPELASLDISPEYLDKTHFRNPPKVEIGADGIPRYRGEAEDIDGSPTSSSLLPAPLSSASLPPLLTEGRITEGLSKRGKRFEPYGTSPVTKRPRKNTKSSPPDGLSPTGEAMSPIASTSSTTSQTVPGPPAAAYPDPNVPMNMGMPAPIPPAYPYGMPTFYPGYPPPPPGHMYGPPASMHQPGPGVQPYHVPPPIAMTHSGSSGSGTTPSPQIPQQSAVAVPVQYARYPGYSPPPSTAASSSSGPGTSGPSSSPPSNRADSNNSTAAATPHSHASDPSQAGPGPASSSTQPAPAAQGGQLPYPQAQPPPQYYPYYPPPPHPHHPHHPPPHAYGPPPGAYQWHQYPAYAHPPPPPPPPHPHPQNPQAHGGGGPQQQQQPMHMQSMHPPTQPMQGAYPPQEQAQGRTGGQPREESGRNMEESEDV